MKILVRATNWIGDAILSLPALHAIRTRWPEAELSILARPSVAEIYRDQQVADHLLAYDSRSEHAGWRGRERLANGLRAARFDLAILFQNAFDAAWLVWRAGIPERIGYARDARSFLLTRSIPVPRPGETPAHEQFYYLELLRRAGWLDALPRQEWISLIVPDPARRHAAEFLLEAGVRPHALRIAIGAGASYGSAKCWPPARFAEMANALSAKFDCDVLLFGTPAEQPVSQAIIAGMNRSPINLTGKTTVGDLPALLSQCHLFIGNDSGAMHVAAAVGVPVVAVFGSTDPNGTAPVTPHCTIVQQRPHCSPCFLRRCPIDHRCMTRIASTDVADAARSWLERRQASHA